MVDGRSSHGRSGRPGVFGERQLSVDERRCLAVSGVREVSEWCLTPGCVRGRATASDVTGCGEAWVRLAVFDARNGRRVENSSACRSRRLRGPGYVLDENPRAAFICSAAKPTLIRSRCATMY